MPRKRTPRPASPNRPPPTRPRGLSRGFSNRPPPVRAQPPHHGSNANRLLAALPAIEYARISPAPPNRPPPPRPRALARGFSNRPPPVRAQPPHHGSNANRLLAALPAIEYARISPALEVVSLKLKQFIHPPNEPISHVYFPGDGFCSALMVLAHGMMVEVATIGREVITGAVSLGTAAAPSSATMD